MKKIYVIYKKGLTPAIFKRIESVQIYAFKQGLNFKEIGSLYEFDFEKDYAILNACKNYITLGLKEKNDLCQKIEESGKELDWLEVCKKEIYVKSQIFNYSDLHKKGLI